MTAIIGTAILDGSVQRVKEPKFYVMIADEMPDISQTEQLSLLVRSVWNGEVEERLLMISVEETTAEALFVAVTQELQKHGIDLHLLRGQCYDGANNVAGVHTGLQARVEEISPSALYTHVLNRVTMSHNKITRDCHITKSNCFHPVLP